MRFVPSPTLPPAVGEAEEPRPIRAVRASRPVETRTRVPQVIQHFGRKEKAGAAAGGPVVIRQEKRAQEDRRTWCRRMQHGRSVLLDTRCGEDRRKENRRSDDVATVLYEEV